MVARQALTANRRYCRGFGCGSSVSNLGSIAFDHEYGDVKSAEFKYILRRHETQAWCFLARAIKKEYSDNE